jgi:2,2-dialkylglycine decarboxylase (pyruvate)
MKPTGPRNLDYWLQYGDYVLMAMPYADEVLVEARNCTLRDVDGKELLDLASGMFTCVLGHNHPRFLERISRQMQALLHNGTQFLSPAVFEASYKLSQVTPGNLQKTIFLSTGTEANEFAFRIAKAYTGRTGIVGLSRGYYGTSLATKSCSSLSSHRAKDSLPTVPESYVIPISPQCVSCFSGDAHQCDFPCLQSAESWIGDWSNVAAIIAEPILSAGGMLLPPPGYLKMLQRLAHENGALFIADEAQTGFGRTGKWFAIEHHGVEPDILTISKASGNGFPVSAVTTTSKIADSVADKGLWHLSSHQSDPVGATAVAAVIDIIREENLLERASENGAYFMNGLRDLSARQPCVQNVRGQGLMIGFDLLTPDRDGSSEAANAFMYVCRRRGVHITYGYEAMNIRIIPPLVITRAEIDFALEVIEKSLEEVLTQQRSKKELWPANPYTRRLLEQRPLRRLVTQLWRSSPEELIAKSKKKFKK